MRLTLAAVAAVGAGAINAAMKASSRSVTTPFEKVVVMLTKLKEQVEEEGEKEAATYNKFACFCKDTMAEKSAAISSGENEQNSLQAQLNEAATSRDAEDAGAQEKVSTIDTTSTEIAQLRESRNADRLKYEKAEIDMTAALQGLDGAIRAVKAAKTATGLVDVGPVKKTLQRALSMEEVLGRSPQQRQAAAAALAQLSSSSDPVYEFKSGDILSTLEDLKTAFKDKKAQLDEEEVAAKQTFFSLVQDKEALVTENTKLLDAHKKASATQAAKIATLSQDLTTTSAQLADDQNYLQDLSAKCNEKAVLWDQRTQGRANEISALFQALELINSPLVSGAAFVEKWSAADQHPMQTAPPAQPSLKHSRLPKRGGAAKAPGATAAPARASQALLARRRAAKTTKTAVVEDPLGSIKTMIQRMVEKLLKEEAEEASHKGWCDKEKALAEQARTYATQSIKEVKQRLASGTARFDQLTGLVQELGSELTALNTTLDRSRELREKEHEENTKAIEDAEKAAEAVSEAIDVLTKYYAEAGQAAAAFVQATAAGKKEAPAAPDAGFSGAYGGAQSGKVGVVAMLEVLRDDFQATAARTRKAEALAEEDFQELEKTTLVSQATKEVAKQDREAALIETNSTNAADQESLATFQGRLDKALGELDALVKACSDGGMTPTERKEKREEEIKNLKQALCILDAKSVGSLDDC